MLTQGVMRVGAQCGIRMMAVRGFGEAARFDVVKERVASTYRWVAFNMGTTGLFGGAAYGLGAADKVIEFMNGHHPLVSCGAFCAVTIAPMIATIWTDEEEHPILKKVMLTASNLTMGIVLSPLGYLGAGALVPATILTTGVSGGLALSARLAKTDWHLKYSYPLKAGLGTVSAAAISALMTQGEFQSILHGVSLYGGIGVFTALMIADVQEVYKEAEGQKFSSIDHSLLIYTDILNIWIRFLEIIEKLRNGEEKASFKKDRVLNNIEITSSENTKGGGSFYEAPPSGGSDNDDNSFDDYD